MIQSDPLLSYLRDPRLAIHATSAAPVWLWSADATRVLWANAAGAAVLGANSLQALAERRMSAGHPLAAQVVRLAGTLPLGGAARLERLRGIGAGVGRTLACTCSRLSLANGTPAILVAVAEPVGPVLPLPERVARLLAACEAPLAAFAADGTLLHATPDGAVRLSGLASLTELEAAAGPALSHLVGTGAAAVRIVFLAEPLPAAAVAVPPPSAAREQPTAVAVPAPVL